MSYKLLLNTLILVLCPYLMNAQVQVYEGIETMPTYQLGDDIPSPVFYTPRKTQGAEGRFYPYPMQVDLGEELVDVEYKLVYLENEYLKVSILPEMGGKLFSAIDKTNGHELFHRNSVVKPDLIGTLGAWTSGGIEWCFPHHHRTSTMMPADYTIVKNKDGSATVWVGETEKSRRLRGIVGITLRPGRSYIEVDYRLNNTNTVIKNFQFWANVAVTANEDFRTFWPPQQEIGVFHTNTSFTQWPLSKQLYHGIDYRAGVDMTWWKNHPDPVSIFFWQGKEGFIGGYDYSQNAGTVHVGNIHENKTSKLWQFGPGLQGENARRKLTDDGRAYVELMTGTYSNNQPGYGWFWPHSVKDAKNFWYPIRDIEIAKNANIDASVTLQMRDSNTVFYGFNTTHLFEEATAILKYKDEVLASNKIKIDPGSPYTSTYKSDKELDEYQLYVALQSSDGETIVAYAPYKPNYPELPEVQEAPKYPNEIESVEDLYLSGRYVEQFAHPDLEPENYYLAALKKSPNDYRANLAMGILCVNKWKYEEALQYFQKVSDKLKALYYQPKEGELYYYRGLAYKGTGDTRKAYEDFYRATWYYTWFSAAYYQLALFESQNGNYATALEYARNAYSTNTLDGRINVLQCAMLRKLGQKDAALDLARSFLEYDPLSFSTRYEVALLEGDPSMMNWHQNMQDIDNNYLEIAVNYFNAGLLEEGIILLEQRVDEAKNPLVYYYLAWFYQQNGDLSKAQKTLESSRNLSLDYVFPFREETQKVLDLVSTLDADNSRAHYLLGNLLYDWQPEIATKEWEKALQLNPMFTMNVRNLAFANFHHENNVEKAVDLIKQAIEQENHHPLWYAELANYHDISGKNVEECITIMEENIAIVKQDIRAPKHLVRFYTVNGEYDKAIDFLRKHQFKTWELSRVIYYQYVDAFVLKALEYDDSGQHQKALSYLKEAMTYPSNLEVGKPLNDDRNAMIYYYMGAVYEKMNQTTKAEACYQKSISCINSKSYKDLKYFQGKSYEKLGETEKAKALFGEVLEYGKEAYLQNEQRINAGVADIYENTINRSQGYYLQAMGNIGLGNTQEGKELLEESLKVYRNNIWARFYLNSNK